MPFTSSTTSGTFAQGAALRTLVVLSVALGIVPTVLGAELSSLARKEVDQLLATIGNSRCEFYRAGTWHSAAAAQAHLEHKFQYLATRQMLTSTEDFISKAATRSSLTGEAYAIRCQAMPAQPSSAWLEAELRSLRSRSSTGATPAR